jgi:uncharacterized protein YwgA
MALIMEEDVILSPQYYIVLKLLAGDSDSPVKGQILFQKMAFLVLQNFPRLLQEADFKAHRFGPYSSSLDESLKELVYQNDVAESKKDGYSINEKGKELLHSIEASIDHDEHLKEINQTIDEIKSDFQGFTADEMLAFIYKVYPDYIDQSVKAKELDYPKMFSQLYERDLLGVSKIAELLGWSTDDTYQFLKERTGHVASS